MQYRRSNATGATFFFTVVTHLRKKILCLDNNPALINDAFQHIAGQHPFINHAFVLLPEHLHCIWTLPDDDRDFSMRWRLIKRYFTKHCTRPYKQSNSTSRGTKGEHGIWQRRFWEHQIRDDDDFSKHVEYIHYNPVKHGLAQAPSKWPHSSFHRYVREGMVESDWGADTKIHIDKDIGNE
jgi:putative transposase